MRFILTLAFVLGIHLNTFATHIVGGILAVEHLSGMTYRVSLTVYRDCINGEAPFDNPTPVGIFDKQTHELITTYRLRIATQQILPFAAASCQNSLPIGCTEVAVSEAIVTLSPAIFNNLNGYYLSYQRCCRNGIIQNIREPGDMGIAIYAEIPSPKFVTNSSPVIGNNPNILLCRNMLTTHNFGFTDADGDELRYSTTTPLRGNLEKQNPQSSFPSAGPYPTVNWVGGYSNAQQIQGSPSLTIHPTTGELTVSPNQIGTFVIAILVEEFRQNVKIGSVILELQVNIADCFQPPPSAFVRDTLGLPLPSKQLTITTPQTGCVEVVATDATDSLFLTIENISTDTFLFPLPTFQKHVMGFKNISTFICWESACSLPLNSSQTFKITLKDNGCPKFATITDTIVLYSIPMANNNPTDLLCMTLADNQQTTLYWGDSTPMAPHFNHYNLYRKVNDGPFELLDSTIDKSTRSYTDNNTPNYGAINYQYIMRSVNHCGNIGLPSDTLGTFEQLKYIPDKQCIISVSVANNRWIDITWPKTWENDFAQYFVYKKMAGEPVYKLIHRTSNINDTIFHDKDVDVSSTSYCYHVVMKDTCDNYGPAGFDACSIVLSGEAGSFKNDLWWTPYNWWFNGISHYELIAKGNESEPNRYIAPDSFFVDVALNPQSAIFNYAVRAHQNGPNNIAYGMNTSASPFYNATSLSNEITLGQQPALFVPNAFTPNNDHLNDVWNIRHLFVNDYVLSVYNKWGQRIFYTTDKNTYWDGKLSSGEYATADVYIYQIQYTSFDHKTFNQKGNVTILR